MRLSLHRAMLHYGPGLVLHTASSGRIDGLDTLYLRVRDADGIEAAGEVRINIAYLNGLAAETVAGEAVSVLRGLEIGDDPLAFLACAPAALSAASAPVRMLIDLALHDLAGKRAGLPLCSLLGETASDAPIAHPTNQTLFLSDDETLQRQAEAYVARGFRDLKLRIGSADFARDLARLRGLRKRFGNEVKLAADANGAWSPEEAPARLEALAGLELSYVEQPIAPSRFEIMAALAEASPVPIMLDESVAGEADVARLARGGHRLMAHLKLVKLGGLGPTLRAARALTEGGVPFMIGQMNEGGLATAAALHLSASSRPAFAELYGADGLIDDPAPGLVYADGRVSVEALPGLGLGFSPAFTTTLWEN